MADLQLISNSQSNHLGQLQKMLSTGVGSFTIVSPFLAADIKSLLREFSFKNLLNIELITTFKPNDPEQLTKPRAIRDFMEFFQDEYPAIDVKVHVDNLLHGKIYIAIGDYCRTMLISSANFTKNGLRKNHEWGVFVNNNPIINDALYDVANSLDYKDVTLNQ